MSRDRERFEEEDDGRTIVDMSGVERPNLFSFRPRPDEPERPEEERRANNESWLRSEVSGEERRWLILGTIKAALLVGSAFGIGILLVILAFARFAH